METSSKLAESVHGPGLGKQSEVQIMMWSMMMMMAMMIMEMVMMIQTVTIRLQENQNLENGSVSGDEAKLREELAAMTKKATELEVTVTIIITTISIIILINFMRIIIIIAMNRCECEDWRGWVRRPPTGTRLLNGRGVKLPGILCQHNHQHRLHHQVLKESTSKVEFRRISITEVGY